MHNLTQLVPTQAEQTSPTPSAQMGKTPRPKIDYPLLDEGPNCIMLPIQLQTTDTMERASAEAMIDTGETGDFIDQDFVENTSFQPGNYLDQSRSIMYMEPQMKLEA